MSQESVDSARFRAVMRHVPSPVVVVTADGATEARGITIGSFTSVNLDPPLICFNVGKQSQMKGVMESCDRFCVHILGEGQAYLAKHFAAPDLTGAEQFESVPHRRDAYGTPVIDGVTGTLHCVPHDAIDAGNHTVYVGRVVDVNVVTEDGGAVLYYQRSYRGVGKELRSSLLSPVNLASSDSS
jgi:flavin reductase (DIM6/NTAB) family NADH-FMN oxidoreductase RutF